MEPTVSTSSGNNHHHPRDSPLSLKTKGVYRSARPVPFPSENWNRQKVQGRIVVPLETGE